MIVLLFVVVEVVVGAAAAAAAGCCCCVCCHLLLMLLMPLLLSLLRLLPLLQWPFFFLFKVSLTFLFIWVLYLNPTGQHQWDARPSVARRLVMVDNFVVSFFLPLCLIENTAKLCLMLW